MPDLLGSRSAEERRAIAADLVAYLTEGAEPPALAALAGEAIKRGETLFHEVGCVACHNPAGEALAHSAPLHFLEKKYSLGSLTAFLEDPLATRPSGRMPDLGLTHWEAQDLASYLLREQKAAAPEGTEKGNAAAGLTHYREFGCAQCHEPTQARADYATAFAQLDLTQPCSAADYPLSEGQRGLLAKAQLSKAAPALKDQISLKMTQLNCFACHSRDELGGVAAERDEYFTTTNLNLGDQARVPPSLTGVGAKLKPAALRRILLSDGAVRPYMNTRMPRFGSENVEPLLAWFAESDHLEALEFESAPAEDAMAIGHELVGEKNLACNSCHTFFGEKSTTLDALDLTAMWERLEENWFHHYLRNPQNFHPTTIMPGFWPNGRSVRPEILGGDAGAQIDAIWQYLSKGQEARRPEGVRPEPIRYGPTASEAVILRRQYTGIGKRGIGVGYPSAINLSFDSGKMALGSVWRGEFGEMSPVWRGQGSGFVKEAGDRVVRFPPGPAFAQLETASAEWPVVEEQERAAGFQFLGYSLDEQQRPTFRYTFAGLTIEDRFRDFPTGPRLARTLTFQQVAPPNLYFRAAGGERIIATGERTWQLAEGLLLTTDLPGTIHEVEGGQELRLPLAGMNRLSLDYRYSAP